MDVSAFLGLLRRRLPLIVLVVAVGAVGAYVISKGQTEKYSASSKLLLQVSAQQPNGQPDYSPPTPDAAPDKEQLVVSGPVLAATRDRLARRVGERRAAQAVSSIETSAGEESQVVEIKATAPTAALAALAANTLAQANIDHRRAITARKIRRVIRGTEAQLRQLDASNPANAGTASSLQSSLGNLRSQADTNDGDASIVKRATPPSSPTSPKPTQSAVIGGLAGLMLGLLGAVLWEQLDRRLRHSKALEDVFGLPVLANVPKSRALSIANGSALNDLPAAEAEAFQILRANLHYLNTDRELRSIVVTSAGVGDGKSTVALNLAKADALVGKRVLLVEADIRRPKLGSLVGLEVESGLTTFLSDPNVALADVTHSLPMSHRSNGQHAASHTLDVIVAGRIRQNPAELINSDRMRELIREAEREYDLVVLDTAPASMVADAIPLMSQATTVVIVGRVGKLTSDQAAHLREQLERIGAPAFGLVANFASGGGRYGYGYTYD